MTEKILIIDFGSQYTQLIARRVRELNVYSEIVNHRIPAVEAEKIKAKGIILSGGPASVYAQGAPSMDAGIFKLGIPVLGICYGMQLGCTILGGKVSAAESREYGRASLKVSKEERLFKGIGDKMQVWMSHGDMVKEVSGDFEVLAQTPNCPLAGVKHKHSDFYGIQFHPEVTHTPEGLNILRNFLFEIAKCNGDWKMESFIEMAQDRVRKQVGREKVILGLSGGVDSSVAAVLIHEAIGDQLECIFVDNGLLRAGESKQVVETFRGHYHINLHFVDASKRFLDELKGISDPEQKRKTIGRVFIEVFSDEAKKISNARFLAQGTIYPDVIESASPWGGPSVTIKSHHNVGGLPEKLGFELVEPFRELFKDEVRRIGKKLGLNDVFINRHPFPGPGLGIRVIGDISPEKLEILRKADTILLDEIHKAGHYDELWQAFAVLLPVRSVGVMGDERTYESTIAVRLVQSTDGMTADWAYLPRETLQVISNRIINEVKGVNRVVLDISSKPPATIEWE